MQNNKMFRAAAGLVIAANLLAFTACGAQQSVTASAATPSAASTAAVADGQTAVYGKITAVDGAKVTIALGTFSPRAGGQRSAASGSGGDASQGTPPDNGGKQQGAVSSGRQGAPGNRGQGGESLTLTGESKTITISDISILTKQNMRGFGGKGGGQGRGQAAGDTSAQNSNASENSASAAQGSVRQSNATAASLSDLTVGTILKVTYETSSEKLVSVQILGGMSGNRSASSTQSK